MAIARAALLALAGVVAGVLAGWLLLWITLEIENTYLALIIPLLLVAATGAWLAVSKGLRPFGTGVIVGAALEAAFFLYLFAAIRGFDTFD